jgi:hypothetical protein
MPDIYQLINIKLSLTDTTIVDDIAKFIRAFESVFYQHYAEPKFWLWVFLVANVAVFSAPSGADFKGAWSGLALIMGVYVVLFDFFGDDTGVFNIVNSMFSAYLPTLILCVFVVLFITISLLLINLIKSKLLGAKQS